MIRTRFAYGILLGLLVTAFAGDAFAQASVGGAFRQPGYGARVWAMGGAGSATVGDESAIYWNPAMLALLPKDAIGFSYVNLVPGTKAQQSQFAYAKILSSNGSDEGHRTTRHVIGILYTNLRLGINDDNRYTENLLRASYAFSPDHFITFGASMEGFFSSSSVDNFGALGTTVDAAIRLNLTRRTTVAVVARDLFSRYSYDDGRDFKKDRGFVLALGYHALRNLKLEGDAWWNYGKISRYILGAETDYLLGHLALRAGVASLRTVEPRTVPYAGIGVRLIKSHVNIHYTVNMDNEAALEDTHRFTLSILL